jgi:hypothetical protein
LHKQNKAQCVWESRRFYRREVDAAAYDYPEYRRHKFDQFLEESLHTIPTSAYAEWEMKLNDALAWDLLFDQSHIVFDGAWGVALAEIMTHDK